MNQNNSTFYQKLVDLYAGHELPEDLEHELVEASSDDPILARDLRTLRQTVRRLHDQKPAPYTDDTEFRILMKIQNSGGFDLNATAHDHPDWQYRLPMEG